MAHNVTLEIKQTRFTSFCCASLQIKDYLEVEKDSSTYLMNSHIIYYESTSSTKGTSSTSSTKCTSSTSSTKGTSSTSSTKGTSSTSSTKGTSSTSSTKGTSSTSSTKGT